jgi:DNA-binding response OmpR family regulator
MAMADLRIDLMGCSIMVVDDTPANIDVLTSMLEDEGFNVRVATDGDSGLRVAEQARPDLVLMDVMMPGIDGYEACRRLKATAGLEEVPVIFLTARGDQEGIVEGFEAGGVDYVVKPFKKTELLARIRTNLERALLARELVRTNEALEETVQTRTRELQLRVRELEGKDRIAEHLLEVHTLEETLAVVLEVISNLLDLEQIVIHVSTDDSLAPAAAKGLEAARMSRPSEEGFAPDTAAALATARESLRPERVGADRRAALVPIARKGEFLGLIEVVSAKAEPGISEADLSILRSFALQAAVAIKDALVQLDPASWQEELEEAVELDEELD